MRDRERREPRTMLVDRVIGRFPPTAFAMAYGSGVFKQAGYGAQQPMLDMVLAVDDPVEWHRANLEANKMDYAWMPRRAGPEFITQATAGVAAPAGDGAPLDVRFLSNVDPAALAEATRGLDPAKTLAIVVSKSFSTAETLRNGALIKAWIVGAFPAVFGEQPQPAERPVLRQPLPKSPPRSAVHAAQGFALPVWIYEGALVFVAEISCNHMDSPYKGD